MNTPVFLQLSGTHNDDDKVGSVDAELGPLRAPVLLRVSGTSSQVVYNVSNYHFNEHELDDHLSKWQMLFTNSR